MVMPSIEGTGRREVREANPKFRKGENTAVSVVFN